VEKREKRKEGVKRERKGEKKKKGEGREGL
jgi:hypothetical protein